MPKKSQAILKTIVAVSIGVLLQVALSSGQTVVFDGNNNLPPFGSFHGSDFDIVNLENGNVHISIPILSVQQRGRPFTIRYNYDTTEYLIHPNVGQSTTYVIEAGSYNGWSRTDSLGWGVSTKTGPSMPCPSPSGHTYKITYYSVVDPSGAKHATPVQVSSSSESCSILIQILKSPATDGSGVVLDISGNGAVRQKDGTTALIDTNGNLGNSALDSLGRTPIAVVAGPSTTLTTPLGSSITGTSYETWIYKDSGGTAQTWRVDFEAIDLATNLCAGRTPCFDPFHIKIVPKSLTLPTGASYQFAWINSSQGELQSVGLPTGGSIGYTYATRCIGAPPLGDAPSDDICRRGATSRTVAQNGSAATWNYSFGTVTDPNGNDEVHVYGLFVDPVSGQTSEQSVEKEVDFWQGSSAPGAGGTLLKKIVNTYAGTDGIGQFATVSNIRLVQVDTTESGLTHRIQTDYEDFLPICSGCAAPNFASNPIAVREYDWGTPPNLPLLRQTKYAYQHANNQAYIDRNIVDRVTVKTVLDGAGTTIAQTTNEYDNYSHPTQPMVASNAVQHDPNFATNFTIRGNVTAVKQWRNTDGALLTTTNQYDDAGNVISTIDPVGNKTSYDYTDSWADATCAPAGQGKAYPTTLTNALTQSVTRKYNSCTGLLSSATDANTRITSFAYDLLGRTTQASLPDGGSTTNCYSDVGGATCPQTGPPFQVVTTKAVASAVNIVDTSLFDGLGRVTQTQVNSDPDGPTFVDTTYDLLGRVHSVSNPHRSSPATTDGVTTYQYDALGRTCVLVPPDGTAVAGTACPTSAPARDVFTLYSGNMATVTDEAGKSRKTQTDALGRLTSVWEDPASLNYQTQYQYNTLGNLTCVEQHGGVTGTGCSSPPSSDATTPWRVRRFSYNSLSQLLSAKNPESGAIGYTYDADGNLSTKTAPAPNQTGIATVITTYGYDVLNRLTQKSYNDGSTAAVKFGYDGTALTGCTTAPPTLADMNPIGYRTAMCDGSGGTSWKHDELGRSLQEKRKIGTAAVQIVTYTYNLDGSVKTLKYPSAAIVKYTPTGAGRMLAAQDVANSINYVQNAQYAPFGGIASFTQGVTPITTTNTYNSRLQPITLSAAAPAATILSLSYDFHLNNGDNGNAFQIVNNRVGGRTQNFLYDSLNRIQQAYTNANSGQISWGETFSPVATGPGVPPSIPGIDAWGNLVNRSGVTGKAHTESGISCPANNKNQLTTCSMNYDAAGNMIANGSPTYLYDAENRLTKAGGVTYTYDGDGKRVKKSSGTLYWTGMGSEALAESDLTATMQREYIFFNGERVARRDLSDGSVKYYFSDHLGSASVITDAVGTMPPLEESDYYPYGGEIGLTTTDPNTYKFTGKERDSESGLDMFGARYYASTMGRFMTPDWAAKPTTVPYANFGNPQSLNLYSYVQNNPTTVGDPDGHCVEDLCIVEVTVVVTVIESPEGQELVQEAEASAAEALPAIEEGATSIWNAVKGAAAAGAAYLSSPSGDKAPAQTVGSVQSEQKATPEPQVATDGAGKGAGRNGLPPDAVKLKGDQGYRDSKGNTWKKDKLHKDHWDVTDRKGRKIKEITFNGKQLWPDSAKHKQKKKPKNK